MTSGLPLHFHFYTWTIISSEISHQSISIHHFKSGWLPIFHGEKTPIYGIGFSTWESSSVGHHDLLRRENYGFRGLKTLCFLYDSLPFLGMLCGAHYIYIYIYVCIYMYTYMYMYICLFITGCYKLAYNQSNCRYEHISSTKPSAIWVVTNSSNWGTTLYEIVEVPDFQRPYFGILGGKQNHWPRTFLNPSMAGSIA